MTVRVIRKPLDKTKFYGKIFNGSQDIEKHTPKRVIKYSKTSPSVRDMQQKTFFESIDRQSNAKNICTKFNENRLNGFQEIEKYTTKCA